MSDGTAGRFKRKEAGARDWLAIEESPEFQELVKERRSFLVPADDRVPRRLDRLSAAGRVRPRRDGLQVVGGMPFAWLAGISR